MKEFLEGASVERLTEIWLDTRDKDAALAVIDATIAAEHASETQLDYCHGLAWALINTTEADRGAAEG